MTEATIDQSAKDSWEKVLNKIIEDSDMVMLSNAADAAPERAPFATPFEIATDPSTT